MLSQEINESTIVTFSKILYSFLRLKQNHQLERDFSDALWEWREVKSSTEAYDCSLDKEFRADDSRIATCQISRKLGMDSVNMNDAKLHVLLDKVRCVCPMVISSEFRIGKYRPFDHMKDAPHFTRRKKIF